VTTSAALAVTLLVMAAANVWVHLGPRTAHLVTGPLAAIGLLLVARSSGLSWAELGLGRAALVRGAWYAAGSAALVAVAYIVAVGFPATRGAFRDTRYQVGAGSAVRTALVTIPLGTVVFEEVAFRGVLWGLLARDHGTAWATGVSSVLFGLWHVLPALDLARTNTALRSGPDRAGRRVLLTVLGTVAFTTVAGVVFAELRRRSGSLLAPVGLHWATNGLGVLASAAVWAVNRR
jgi:membrane protease YdiL (CAAX protease family)